MYEEIHFVMSKKIKIFSIIALIVAINPQQAFAYLDPGTGSMIMQVIVASIVGAGAAIGVFKQKIISFFKSIGNKSDK